MTEDEWAQANIVEMAKAVSALGPRRARLLATAGCRLLTNWATHPAVTGALLANERYADGELTRFDLNRSRQAVGQLLSDMFPDDTDEFDELTAQNYCVFQAIVKVCEAVDTVIPVNAVASTIGSLERTSFDDGLRRLYTLYTEITGPSYSSTEFSDTWRSSNACGLAGVMYESSTFDRMLILADALEEAGCDDPAILAHCRDPNLTHVRGCWVVDLVLG